MDIATLGLRIENGQFVQGAKQAEAATQSLGRSSDALTAKLKQEDQQLRLMVETEHTRTAARNASIRAHLQEIGMLDRYLAIQRQVDEEMRVADQVTAKLNANTAANVTHTNNATVGANRFRSSLSTLASQALGTSSSLGQLGGLLATFAVGSGAGVAIIAGIAAIAFAYDQLTSSTRKAKEETQDFLKSLRDQAQAAKDASVSGSEQRAEQARQLERDAIAGAREFNRTGGGPAWQARKVEQRIADATRDRILAEANAAKILAAANREVAEAGNRANVAMAESNSAAIEQLKRIDKERQATHDREMARLEERSRRDAEFRKEQEDREKRTIAGVRAMLDELDKAERARRAAFEKAAGIDPESLRDSIKYNVNEALQRDADAKKYMEDMRQIWRQGIGKIITDGTKSFRDFFEDVLQLFSRMMARMEQEGKNKGGLYRLLGIGSAAIGGAFAGYQTGQQLGSTAAGGVGGAVSGAILGAQIAGPVGAVVGGLTGLVGGLLGGAAAAKAHALALKAAMVSITSALGDFHALATGTAGSLDDLIRQVHDQAAALRVQAEANIPHQWWNVAGQAAYQAALAQIDADEKLRIQHLREADAAKQAADALNALTTAVRNAPSGFKIESYVNRYADARPWGIGGPMSIPYSPNRGGLGGGTTVIQFREGSLRGAFVINGDASPEEITKKVVGGLRKIAAVTVGGNAPLAEALDWA